MIHSTFKEPENEDDIDDMLRNEHNLKDIFEDPLPVKIKNFYPSNKLERKALILN